MAAKIAGFKSTAGEERFIALYERAVDELWPIAAEELDVATRFGSTHVRRSGGGDGVPLVMLPGNSGTSVGWYSTVEAFADRRTVVAVDTIGALGRSIQTSPLAGPRDLAVWFRDLLDGLDAPSAHLLGYSEGAFVALHAALGNEDRVASLVYIDGIGVEKVRLRFIGSLALTIGKILLRVPNAMRDYGQRMVPGVEISELEWELMTTGAKALRPALPMPRKVSDDHLRRVTTPTLLYMAANSEVCDPVKAARRAKALMPNVEAVIVPNTGHGLPLTHPERTTRDILDFVARHEPAN